MKENTVFSLKNRTPNPESDKKKYKENKSHQKKCRKIKNLCHSHVVIDTVAIR